MKHLLSDDPRCICGDLESEHVDAKEQCVILECGCKEFTNEEQELEAMKMDEIKNDLI